MDANDPDVIEGGEVRGRDLVTGLPKTVVRLVAENMGLDRSGRTRRAIRTVLDTPADIACGRGIRVITAPLPRRRRQLARHTDADRVARTRPVDDNGPYLGAGWSDGVARN